LREIKAEFGIKVIVEVANAKHVDEVLQNSIDAVWIGARTTVNPFSVQEIADALKGSDLPVFIKNPVHPDLGLWVGAIERLLKSDCLKLAAIHRGFHSELKTKYRNQPLWGIPIALRELFPEIPMICDPSHICGKTEGIKELAQTALDLGFDGLMLESHPKPAEAKSDSEQQLLPSALIQLVNNLSYPQITSSDKKFNDELYQFRKMIDEIDEEILAVIRKRHEVIEKIGDYKKVNNVTVFQLERWKEILKTRGEWAKHYALDADFSERLCRLLHDESIRIQTDKNPNSD
jgi:chorismate mutase